MSKQRVSNSQLQAIIRSEKAIHVARRAIAQDLLDERFKLAAAQSDIAAIGSAMGSAKLTAVEIERLIHEGNVKASKMYTDLAETREKLAAAQQRCRDLEGALKDAVDYIDKAHNRMPNVLYKAEAMGVCAELAAIAAQRQKEREL